MHFSSFFRETSFISIPLLLAGLVLPWPGCQRRIREVLIAMVIFYLGFFNSRANLVRHLRDYVFFSIDRFHQLSLSPIFSLQDISNPLLAGVQERFWMQPNMARTLIC
jgi:hypothetical protein